MPVISLPVHLHQILLFIDYIDHLYPWCKHQIELKDMVQSSVIVQEEDFFFSSVGASNNYTNTTPLSPNVYLTPTTTRNPLSM